MARDCRACQDLRTDAAEFYANGVTDTVRTSLMNDTGLNPSLDPQHDDCYDLQRVIDCYVGNATAEVDGYDVCEWKDYMKAFLPKLYDNQDAFVATFCGILARLKALEGREEDICKILDLRDNPDSRTGTITRRADGADSRVEILNYNEQPTLRWISGGTEKRWCGIKVLRDLTKDCRGDQWLYNYIQPTHSQIVFNQNVPAGTALWRIRKTNIWADTDPNIDPHHLSKDFVNDWTEWTWVLPVHDGYHSYRSAIFYLTTFVGEDPNNYIYFVYGGNDADTDLTGYAITEATNALYVKRSPYTVSTI